MKYRQQQTDHEITLDPVSPATASVVWLHGLGADGWDFVPIVDELGLPDSMPVRFVFPHAPQRRVTINNGLPMRAWYDVKAFTPEGRAEADGLDESVRRVNDYLQQEAALGLASSRTVLAGFSQGGAVALHAGLRSPTPLAGLLALSTYLPRPSVIAADKSAANAGMPILMCHGQMDPILPIELGIEARDALIASGCAVEWREYPMQHQVCVQEIADVSRWLRERFA